jgi:hypothetical protein
MKFSKVYLKISVLFELFQNLEISELVMAKIQYYSYLLTTFEINYSPSILGQCDCNGLPLPL